MKKILIVKYNPKWKIEFEKAKKFYKTLLEAIDIKIEHVGSTSVKGLWAKPILDIDIIVRNKKDNLKVIKKLTSVGYIHLGNLGVEGREAFKYEENNSYITWMEHHLYVCIKGSENLENHLLLREHLRNNVETVEAYSKLKRDLADKFPYDISSYIDGKTNLIISILEAKGMNKNKLKNIKSINKLKD